MLEDLLHPTTTSLKTALKAFSEPVMGEEAFQVCKGKNKKDDYRNNPIAREAYGRPMGSCTLTGLDRESGP